MIQAKIYKNSTLDSYKNTTVQLLLVLLVLCMCQQGLFSSFLPVSVEASNKSVQ